MQVTSWPHWCTLVLTAGQTEAGSIQVSLRTAEVAVVEAGHLLGADDVIEGEGPRALIDNSLDRIEAWTNLSCLEPLATVS